VKTTAPASALIAAITMIAPAAAVIKLKTDRKPPPDIAVRIIASGSAVTFAVTNQRAGISVSAVTAAKITTAGEIATSATRLSALLAAFPANTTVEIATDGTTIQVSSTASCYRLTALSDLPAAFAIDGETGRVELPRADCLKLLEVLPAAAIEKSRQYLCGMHLHTHDDQLIAVSTDGTALLTVSVPADHFSDDARLIIPAAAATVLRRLLRQTKADSVTLRRSRGLFSVTAPGSFQLITALIDAGLPDYRRVMPEAAGNAVACQRVELLGALARLQAVSSGLVSLSWDEGATELLIGLPREPGIGIETLPAHIIGSASKVFDLARLAPLISEFASEAVHLDVTDRALLIHRGNKTGVLASCHWADKEIVAVAA
jgi:DNA polymerase-3 subunit beta